jgi:hypothetical protein
MELHFGRCLQLLRQSAEQLEATNELARHCYTPYNSQLEAALANLETIIVDLENTTVDVETIQAIRRGTTAVQMIQMTLQRSRGTPPIEQAA